MMKKLSLSILCVLSLALVASMGCGKKEEEETTSGFKNDKPVPAEDGGGAAAK